MDKKELKKLIEKGESRSVEFKESLSLKDKIGENVSAFSNTRKGFVLVGVADSGEIKGIDIGKKTIESLANYIKQHTDNHVYPAIDVKRIDKKEIIIIEIDEKSEKPVFFKGKAYKRIGKSVHRLSASEIRELAKKSTKTYWDEQACEGASLDDIDMEFVKKIFIPLYEKTSDKKITGNPNELLESLNCIRNNKPTNAGILLFGKNPQKIFAKSYIALARYKGNVESVERLDYKEFNGNLFGQIDKCNDHIIEHIAIMSNLEPGKIKREDIPEYGRFSVRELITNAVCHRDYEDQHTKVIIKMFSDKITFYNPGGLPKDITPKNITEKQFSRNQNIANALAKVRYIEELGEGWNKIIKEHKDHLLKPSMPMIESDESTTLVTINSIKEKFKEEEKRMELNDRQKKIIKFIEENGRITTSSCATLLDASNDTALRELTRLKSINLIKRNGIGRNIYYVIK